MLYARVVRNLKEELLLGHMFGKIVICFEDPYFAKRFVERVNHRYSLLMRAKLVESTISSIDTGINVLVTCGKHLRELKERGLPVFSVDGNGNVERISSGYDDYHTTEFCFN